MQDGEQRDDPRDGGANFSVYMSAGVRVRLDARAREEGHESRSRLIERYCVEGLNRDDAGPGNG